MKLNLDVAARIVSADRIANGAWLHLQRPGMTDAPIYADADGKHPARIKVRSHRTKEFQDATYAAAAAASTNRKGRSRSAPEIARELQATIQPRNFSLLVMSWENLDPDQLGVEITPGKDDLIEIAKNPEHQWIVEQVINFAFNDGNFGADEEPKKAGNA